MTECMWGDEKVSKCLGEAAEADCDFADLVNQPFNSVSIKDYTSVEEARKPVNKGLALSIRPYPRCLRWMKRTLDPAF